MVAMLPKAPPSLLAKVANTQELNIEGNGFCSGGSSNRQLRIRGLVEIRSQLLLKFRHA